MKITVDSRSGFCTGVQRAVERAEKKISGGGNIYSLGQIVHNPGEVDRLADLGLEAISDDAFKSLKDATVLIRAHGEPPETFETAKKNNLTLIDATCPVVKRLQTRIRAKHLELKKSGGLVLIFGKKDHPEVRALLGYTDGEAHVVRTPEDLEGIEPGRPLALYSQTTMNPAEFKTFQSLLRQRLQDQGADPDQMLEVHDTICTQVSSRESYLREFAASHDAIIFVSGRESSNGRVLFRVCREVNPESYFISSPEETDRVKLEGIESLGISGATSTPGWLIRDVEMHLRRRMNPSGGKKR